MSPIPVIFVWRKYDEEKQEWKDRRQHQMVPCLPAVGDLVKLSNEASPRNVRAREWDLSDGRTTLVLVHIVLDD